MSNGNPLDELDLDDELNEIGSPEEREEALNLSASPSIVPPESLMEGLTSPSIVPASVPTGLRPQRLSIPEPRTSMAIPTRPISTSGYPVFAQQPQGVIPTAPTTAQQPALELDDELNNMSSQMRPKFGETKDTQLPWMSTASMYDIPAERMEEVSKPSRWSRLTPITSPTEPIGVVPPKRGIFEELGLSTVRGVVGAGELFARAGRTLSPTESPYTEAGLLGQTIETTSQALQSETLRPSVAASGGNKILTAIVQGVESIIPSFAAGLPAAAAGALIGSAVPVVGIAIGGLIGFALGTGGAFFASEYDRFMEEAKKANISESKARPYALLSGTIEGGVEFVTNIIAGKLLGIGAKSLANPIIAPLRQMLSVPLKRAAVGMAKQMPIEVGTEMLQNAGETYLRQQVGVPVGESPWEAAKAAIGPTIVMTFLYFLGARGANRLQQRSLVNALTSPDATPEARNKAINYITDSLFTQASKQKDGSDVQKQLSELATRWDQMARTVQGPINIDQTLAGFVQPVTAAAVKPAEPETTPFVGEEVIPEEGVALPPAPKRKRKRKYTPEEEVLSKIYDQLYPSQEEPSAIGQIYPEYGLVHERGIVPARGLAETSLVEPLPLPLPAPPVRKQLNPDQDLIDLLGVPTILPTQTQAGPSSWRQVSPEERQFWVQNVGFGEVDTARDIFGTFKGNFAKASPGSKFHQEWRTLRESRTEQEVTWESTAWEDLTPTQQRVATEQYERDTGDEARFARNVDWAVNSITGEVKGSTKVRQRQVAPEAPTPVTPTEPNIETIAQEEIQRQTAPARAEVPRGAARSYINTITRKLEVNPTQEAFDELSGDEDTIKGYTVPGKVHGEEDLFYPIDMWERKLNGENIEGIPRSEIEGATSSDELRGFVRGYRTPTPEQFQARLAPQLSRMAEMWVAMDAQGNKFYVEAVSKWDAIQKAKGMSELTITGAEKATVGAKFSKRVQPNEKVVPLSIVDTQRVVDNITLGIVPSAVEVQVFQNFNTMPSETKQAIRKFFKGDVLASAITDRRDQNNIRIYIFSDLHASTYSVAKSLFHEIIGHVGFERIIADKNLKWIVDQIHKIYGVSGMADIYSAYGLDPNTPQGRRTAALEKVGQISETHENPNLWRQIVTWLKDQVKQIFGYDFDLTEDDIRVYLHRSRQLMFSENKAYQGQIFAAKSNLIQSGIFRDELPMGYDDRFSMRIDTSPSDDSQAENMSRFMAWYSARSNRKKNFDDKYVKQLGTAEAIYSNPHFIAAGYPSFQPVYDVELTRHDNRNKDRTHLLKNPTTNEGENPYLTVKDTTAADKIITWSDQNDFYLSDNEDLQSKAKEILGRSLTDNEIAGYHNWKAGFDRAITFISDSRRKISLEIYNNQPWYNQLKSVMEQGVDPNTLQFTDPQSQKDFGKALKATRRRFKQVEKQEEALRKINFYAPRTRGTGPYVVRVQDIDESGKPITIWRENFGSMTKAEMARVKLSKEYSGLNVVKSFEPKTSEFLYGGLDYTAMEAFLEKAMNRTDLDEEQVDKLMDSVSAAIDEEIAARGFRQRFMQREHGRVIGGYRTDSLKQVFVDYMSGLAGSISKLRATYQFHHALQNIDKTREQPLYEYGSRYVKDMLRNSDALDRKINALKTIPYAWYLTANLRLALIQATQNLVTAAPILHRLAKEAGVKPKEYQRLGQASADIATGNLTKTERKMLKEALEEGQLMDKYIQSIKGRVESGWARKTFMKVIDVAAIPFSGMEKFNRRLSILAAFRMYTEAGMGYDEAFRLSKEFVGHTHYDYGLSNYPQILRDGTPLSKILSLGYVFKSFPHNYILSMKHFARNKEGKIALDVMFRSIATLAILGGLGAVPFLDDLLDEAEKVFGTPYRTQVRQSLAGLGGQMLADIGMDGIPALAGINIGGSLRISVPIPFVGSWDPSTAVFGVWEGLVDKAKRMYEHIGNSEWAKAIEAGSPAGIEMMFKAERLAREGVRTGTGRPILGPKGQPLKLTPYEIGTQMVALRPEKLAQVSRERRVAANIKEHYSKRRNDIRKRFRTAKPSEMGAIGKDIQKYNMDVMKFRGIIPRIDASSIRQAFKPYKEYAEYTQRGNF